MESGCSRTVNTESGLRATGDVEGLRSVISGKYSVKILVSMRMERVEGPAQLTTKAVYLDAWILAMDRSLPPLPLKSR